MQSSEIHSYVALARAQLLDLMPTVTVEAVTSQDVYGKPVYGAAVTVRCFIINKRVKTNRVGQAGSDIEGSTLLIIPENRTINLTDRVTLPGGRTPRIIDVEYFEDASGEPYAVEVKL